MAEYISVQGYRRLEAELRQLLDKERPRVVKQVSAAAAEGDRSENAEYIYGKKRLRQIDKRVEFLNRRLDLLTTVEQAPLSERVRFLSWVELEDIEGELRCYRLVGADETDAKMGLISYRSPVGRALLGRELDETVNIQTPGGGLELTILGIHQQDPRG